MRVWLCTENSGIGIDGLTDKCVCLCIGFVQFLTREILICHFCEVFELIGKVIKFKVLSFQKVFSVLLHNNIERSLKKHVLWVWRNASLWTEIQSPFQITNPNSNEVGTLCET